MSMKTQRNMIFLNEKIQKAKCSDLLYIRVQCNILLRVAFAFIHFQKKKKEKITNP